MKPNTSPAEKIPSLREWPQAASQGAAVSFNGPWGVPEGVAFQENSRNMPRHAVGISTIILGVAVIVLASINSVCAQPASRINRIDLFDKSDNKLLFVTFDYDASGNNTGRSVFMADSTFIRSTTFRNDVSGNRQRETSFNFNGDTAGYTTFTTVNAKPTISAFDQFGLEQFGGPVSYGATATNQYDVSQKSATINKMQYLYGASGSLARIDVQDAAGQLQYYVLVNPSTGAIIPPRRAAPKPSLSVTGSRFCRIRLTVDRPSLVRLDAFTPAGRRVTAILSTICGPGNADLTADLASARIPDGLYLLRVSIDGATVLSRRHAIIGIAGGGR